MKLLKEHNLPGIFFAMIAVILFMVACKKTVTPVVGNNIQWMKVFSDTPGSAGGNNIIATNDGGFILDHLTGNGANTFIRYDKNGNEIWKRVFQHFIPAGFCLNPNNEILSLRDSSNFIVINKIDNYGDKTTLLNFVDTVEVTRINYLGIIATYDGGCMAYGSYKIKTDGVPTSFVDRCFYFKMDNSGIVNYKQIFAFEGVNPTITGCEKNTDLTYTFICRDQIGSGILFNTDINGYITKVDTFKLGFRTLASYVFNNNGTQYMIATGDYNSLNNSFNTTVIYMLNPDHSVKKTLTIPVSGQNNFNGSYRIAFTPLQNGFDLLVNDFKLPPQSNFYTTSYAKMIHIDQDLTGYTIYPLQPYYDTQPIGICETTDGDLVMLYMVLNIKKNAFDYCITKTKNAWQ